ncbi:PAS domain S-box protein [Candidatus Dojkabacteria bacterium]|nr:PAS domain S-box protein [Candidatus Dojkabacteria bacterium]
MLTGIINQINNFLTSGITAERESYEMVKIRFFNALGLIAIIVISGFAIANIQIKDYVPALIEIMVVIIAAASIFYVRTTKDTTVAEITGPLIILIMSVQNLITGGFAQSGLLFMMPYPIVVFFMAGSKKGLAWMLVFIASMFGVYILFLDGILESPYPLERIKMAFGALILVAILVYVYQTTYERTHKLLRAEREKYKRTSETFEKGLEKERSADKKLKQSVGKMALQQNQLENTQKAILNVLEDIEEEKTETEKQKDELEKFKEAVDNASDHIIITDPDGIILYANQAVEKITGYTRNEILGKTPALWGKQMSKKFYKKFWTHIKDKKLAFNGEIVNRRKTGEKYIAEAHISPIIEKDAVKAFVGIERDITREKEIDKTKNEFVSVASHQLRTPLTGIKWFLEVLADQKMTGELNEKQKQYIESLHSSADRMIVLVNDLLNVSRIDTGRKFDIEREKANIIKVLKDAINENAALAKNSRIKIDIESTLPDKLEIYVDSNKIFEVFKNIINNAIKYSSQDDAIHIGVKENTKDYVTFYIQDEGLGIPKKAQANIFKKFYRAQNVLKEQTDGSGLGLYIAKAIVNGHQGEIWFESTEGKGTTFFIKLPKTGPVKTKEEKTSAKTDGIESEVNKEITEALLENEEKQA